MKYLIEQLVREHEEVARQLGGTVPAPAGADLPPLPAAGVSVAAAERIEALRRERRETIERISRDIQALRRELGKQLTDRDCDCNSG